MFIKVDNRKSSLEITLKLDKRLVAMGAVSGLGAFLYSFLFERKWIEVSRHILEVKDLPEAWRGFRFAWLSDLHLGNKGATHPVSLAFDKVIAERPDLILLGGDYFDEGQWVPECDELFGKLVASGIPVVAVWGNHDYFGTRSDPPKNRKNFERLGIRLLVNEVHCLERGGIPQYLLGLDDSAKGAPDPVAASRQLPPGTKPLVVMSHNPNYSRELPEKFCELILSGHTHGGQINPALPPYQRELNWIKFSSNKHHHTLYPQGSYVVNGNRLYVGRGVGVTSWALRFNARPEVPIFELRPAG